MNEQQQCYRSWFIYFVPLMYGCHTANYIILVTCMKKKWLHSPKATYTFYLYSFKMAMWGLDTFPLHSLCNIPPKIISLPIHGSTP